MKTTKARWDKAQKAEKNCWDLKNLKLTNDIRDKAIATLEKYSGFQKDLLKPMRILEIGGTIVEAAFFDDDNSSLKIIIDSSFPFYTFTADKQPTCKRIKAMAEQNPLPNGSIDLCYCANVIDHTLSPEKVIQEIVRVLDKKGTLVISCDTFPGWTKPLFPIFELLDKPHPHHFTRSGFMCLITTNGLTIKHHWISSLVEPGNRKTLKTILGTIINVKYEYYRCNIDANNE